MIFSFQGCTARIDSIYRFVLISHHTCQHMPFKVLFSSSVDTKVGESGPRFTPWATKKKRRRQQLKQRQRERHGPGPNVGPGWVLKSEKEVAAEHAKTFI